MEGRKRLANEYAAYFLSGNEEAALRRAKELIDSDLEPMTFFQQVFTPAMEEIGEKFSRLDIYLPELLIAAKTAQIVSEEIIKPAIMKDQGSDGLRKGSVILGSVKGDVHTIGKTMVALMLEVNGFDVIDLGVDVPSRVFIDRALEIDADIVGLSSLMTTSMPYMKEVIALRNGLGHGDRFSIIVGGAPITQEFSAEIGADSFGRDAIDAVKKCTQLMELRKQNADIN